MPGNRGVAYIGTGKVEVKTIDYPKLEHNGKKLPHAVILKLIATNICGSDQHMVRGRTTAPSGMILGHEITGEIVEKGNDVEFLEMGDIVSAPFNIACGRCRNCKEGKTGICLNVNPSRPGGAYGYVDMGGWTGGQADYVLVPYADFNLLKFPDKQQAMAKIRDLTLLSDIFPTGYHGAVTAGVGPGSTVYVAGAGPVGLACAEACRLLGAAVVIVGDMIPERLKQAGSFGCETIDLQKEGQLGDRIAQILGVPEVDSAVDCVGFEARAHGDKGRRGACDGTQFADDCGARWGSTRYTRPLRYRRSREQGRKGKERCPWDSHRARLGEVAYFCDRTVPGDALQPPAHDGHSSRESSPCKSRERGCDLVRRCAERLRRFRQGRGQEVCA